MFRFVLFFVVALLSCLQVSATHNRAGEITYKQIGPLTYEATIWTYTKSSSIVAHRDSLEINWGDGTITLLPLISVDSSFYHLDVNILTYSGTHTYDSPGSFVVISTVDPNRIANIININGGNSANLLFYTEDTIFVFPPLMIGFNDGPSFLNPPIELATVGKPYTHSLCAHDLEGDSLAYRLVSPLVASGGSVPNYLFPDQIMPGPNNQISINHSTGEIVWDSPQAPGIYAVAIVISEYRCGVQLSTIIRDMQIIVYDEPNEPPTLLPVNDVTVFSGDPVQFQVYASDTDSTQIVSLSATGGPFEFTNNPAQLQTTSGGNTALGTFSWIPQLSQASPQPYIITFKAIDDYTTSGGLDIPLTSFSTIKLTVLPHPDSTWANPCDSFTPTSISSEENPNVQVFPNPSNGLISFRNLGENSTVQIFDQAGQLVFTKSNLKETEIIKLDEVTGIYFYQIIAKEQFVTSGKLVLN